MIFSILFSFSLKGQDSIFNVTDTLSGRYYLLNNVTRDGETLPEIEIKEVSVRSSRSLASIFQDWRYQRLIFNIKRVYPYAIIVRERLWTVNQELYYITSEKERKKYLNQVEKDVFANYEDDMREMTITQGRLLIKLIDRETSNTSYELLQDYKGNFNAAFWQGIARIFGTNLKEEYDPSGEDLIIEYILNQIDAGIL
jgi:hypothetical protein